jgi:hypothetical protein
VGLNLVPHLTVSKNHVVQKVRELPVPGELQVAIGDVVKATDVVAKAYLPGDLLICRVAESLGIEAQEVVTGLQVQEGDVVSEGQIICEHSGIFGLFKSRYTAPALGTIELIQEKTGHIAIRQPSNEISLAAYIGGHVVATEAQKSLTVETKCRFVQGIFGVGGEQHGKIKLLDCSPDESPSISHLPESCAGLVLVGGTAPTGSVLKEAEDRGATGWILGAIDDIALTHYLGHDIGLAFTGHETVGMTVIVTEGFGRVALAQRVLQVLADCDGKACSLNGATQVRAGAVRPELIVPYKNGKRRLHETERPVLSFEVGAIVRIIREPYFGQTGTITELPIQPEVLVTGARSRIVKISLENGEVVSVPRSNVELCGE